MNKKMLTLAVSAALAAPTMTHAVKYKLSGQVNRAAVYQTDDHQSDIQFIDNDSSGSRWRMNGSEDIGNGTKVGFNWEWGAQSNPGGSAIGSGDAPGFSQDLRRSEVWFSSNWGKLSLGQGDGAGNGATESSLAGTGLVAGSGRTSFGGAVAWRTSAGAGIDRITGAPVASTAATALTHGNSFSAFDAFSRYDRLRYDTPSLGPVNLSVSAGQADKYEGAVRWAQSIGGGQISSAAFYGTDNGATPDLRARYGGSIAYLFSFGTNLAVNLGVNDSGVTGDPKAETWYLQAGHRWGNNAVSLGYGESKDVIVDYKDKGFNIGFNHTLPKAMVDLYAGYHFNQLDTPTTVASADDIQLLVLGTRLRFD